MSFLKLNTAEATGLVPSPCVYVFNPPHFHFAGSYVFIETSFPRKVGDKAYLISQPFDPTNSTGICLKFWHHMKGASIGTLNVYIYTGNFSSMSLLWQRKGNKGNNWMLGQTPIRSSVKYQVKIMCPQRGFDIAVVVVVVVLVNQFIPNEA